MLNNKTRKTAIIALHNFLKGCISERRTISQHNITIKVNLPWESYKSKAKSIFLDIDETEDDDREIIFLEHQVPGYESEYITENELTNDMLEGFCKLFKLEVEGM